MGLGHIHNYADDIMRNDFCRIAKLLRKGGLSSLNQEELNLLADHLEGTLKRKVGRRRTTEENSEYIYLESECLMNTGMMIDEFNAFCRNDPTVEDYRKIFSKKEYMNRDETFIILEEKTDFKYDNIKKLFYKWKKFADEESERFDRDREW